MEFAKVINGEICFRDKEHDNVFTMFESRFWMFKWVKEFKAIGQH